MKKKAQVVMEGPSWLPLFVHFILAQDSFDSVSCSTDSSILEGLKRSVLTEGGKVGRAKKKKDKRGMSFFFYLAFLGFSAASFQRLATSLKASLWFKAGFSALTLASSDFMYML